MAAVNVKELIELLDTRQSPYSFYDEILDENFTAKIQVKSKDEVMASFLNGDVVKSDMFILLAVATFTFATRTMIIKFLDYYNQRNPELPIPNEEHLKSRMDTLRKYGFINQFSFQVDGIDRRQYYYCLTAHSFAFLKKQVDYRQPYDDYTAITPMDDSCKQLDVSYVLSEFAKFHNTEFIGSTEKIYSRRISSQRLYGKVKMKTSTNTLHIAIEPMYKAYDKAMRTEGQYQETLKLRIDVIAEFVEKVKSSSRIPMVIILVEDYDALKKYMSYFVKHHFGLINYMKFTSVQTIFEVGIKKSLISIVEIDDKTMTPRRINNGLGDSLEKYFI